MGQTSSVELMQWQRETREIIRRLVIWERLALTLMNSFCVVSIRLNEVGMVTRVRRTNHHPAARTTREKQRTGHAQRCRRIHREATEGRAHRDGMADGDGSVASCGARWPTMLARIGIMKALHRHDVRGFKPSKKKT